MNANEIKPPEDVVSSGQTPVEIRHILVPLDFSEASRHALDYAMWLAGKFGAKITLLHVVPPQIFYPEAGMAIPDEGELMSAARKTMALGAAKLVPSPLLKETTVRNGRPCAEIVRFAQEQDVDLIVMTTHGSTGLAHAFLGSTVEKVILSAPCPVLAVRRR